MGEMQADDRADETFATGRTRPQPQRGRLGLVAVGLLLAGAYGWWAVGLAPFSDAATVAVLATGAVAVGVGAGARPPGTPLRGRPAAAGVTRWGVLTLVAGGWQLAAYLQHPRDDHPTLSSLTNALLDSQPARAAAFVVWVVAAVELARR